MRRTTQLKEIIDGPGLGFLMEAHNGLSAKIVEETGFKGIWASSLSISASMGLRDNNELSYSHLLDIIEFMADATSIPILVDGDSGYGDFNNVRILVKKLEKRDVAGVCIEDKKFPKANSFSANGRKDLVDIKEFCGKIKAAKDTQLDNDFVFVARTEALIAGEPLSKALDRAYAYEEAGADALVIHSKQKDESEIEAFFSSWQGVTPIIVIPTTYFKSTADSLKKLGVSVIIWANHNLRASINAMRMTSRRIFSENYLGNIEPDIASIDDVFRIQDLDEWKEAEKLYNNGK